MRPLRWIASLAVAGAVLILGAASAAAAVGPFAPGFGKGGRLGVSIGEGPALGGLAQDPGGGFIVAGSANGAADEYAFLRLGPTGRVDTSFGNWRPDRRSFFPIGSPGNTFPVGVVARHGGWATAGGHDGEGVVLVGHRADGSVDPSFGNAGGLTVLDLPTATPQMLTALTDGRLLVGGWLARGGAQRFFVARFDPDGVPDPAFGSGGVAELSPPSGAMCDEEYGSFGVHAILPAADGSGLLYVAGTTSNPATDEPVPVVMRLRADGSPDPQFGSGGMLVRPPAGGTGTVVGAVPRGTGMILGVGLGDRCDNPTPTGFGAVAVKGNGGYDRAYGRNGTVVARFPAAVTAHAMTRVSGGRVAVVGGTGQFYVQHEFAVARFTASGRVDRTFGGGRTCGEVEGFGLDDAATAVLPLSDGGMLVGGSSQSDADSLTFARYRPTFTAGGVECFEPEELLGPQPLRSVALPVILGRRGRIALLVRSGGYASAGRFRRVCLGTHGPGNGTLHWDGRIAGRRLRPGPYALVLESRDRRGHLVGRSYLRAIGLPRRASGPRRTHAC